MSKHLGAAGWLFVAAAVAAGTACGKSDGGGNTSASSTAAGAGSTAKAGKIAWTPCITTTATAKDSGFAANHLLSARDILWENGQTLNILFRDGDPKMHEFVKKEASEWTEYANLKFAFFEPDAPPPVTHIEVTFDEKVCGRSHHSALGNLSMRRIAEADYSVCFSVLHLDSRPAVVVKHEFGHALGLVHEHQRGKVSWNREKVYQFCQESQGWDRKMCDEQVLVDFEALIPEHDQVGTPYDRQSIMHYSVPAELTTDGVGIEEGKALSAMDKKGIADLYPKTNTPTPTPSGSGGGFISLRNSVADGNWTLYLDGPADRLGQVKSVRYILHPSIVPDEADGDGSKPGFPYTGSGDKTFTVRALVSYQDNSAELLKHSLDLTATGPASPQPITGPPTASGNSSGVAECDERFELIMRCGPKLGMTDADRRSIEQDHEAIKRILKQQPEQAEKARAFCTDIVTKLKKAGCE